MAKRPATTAEEKVADLNRRATETQRKARQKSIEMAMRNQPSCIDPLYEKLRSMGFTEDKIANKDRRTNAIKFCALATPGLTCHFPQQALMAEPIWFRLILRPTR